MLSACSILAATSSDLPVLAAYLHTSKLNLAINRFIFENWPNDAVQKAKYTKAIEGSLDDPTTISLKVVNDNTGEIIAYMFLTPRMSGKSTKLQNSTTDEGQSDGLDAEVAATVMKVVAEINEQWANVDYLGLLPARVLFKQHLTTLQSSRICTSSRSLESKESALSSFREPLKRRALPAYLLSRVQSRLHMDFLGNKVLIPLSMAILICAAGRLITVDGASFVSRGFTGTLLPALKL